MCFSRALEMEGEFQVGEKCVPGEDPRIMAVDVAQMSDAEICNLTRGHSLCNTNSSDRHTSKI